MSKKNEHNPDVEAVIRGYFDYGDQSETMRAFQKGIDQCIHDHVNSKLITSPATMNQLNERFAQSAIPEEPRGLADYAAFLQTEVIPHAVNVGSPGYVGHMTSMLPAFFQHISRLMTVLNQNNVKVETSKVYTLIERQTIAMLHRLVYEQPESVYREHLRVQEGNFGIITSCGTLANITALWIARNKVLQPQGEFQGLQSEGFTNALKHYGFQDAVIIGSTKMHYSMDKLGSLIGLGAENIIKVGLNSRGSIDIKALEQVILRCKKKKRLIVAVVGIAGATETGQIDDLPFMAKVSREHRVHFHVDAAWAGPILFSETNKHLLKGIELADSVTICGHKQLYLPQGISLVLCKDPKDIYHIKATADYQARSGSFDLGKHSPEGSRPATCAYLHAALHLMGKKGYGWLMDHGIEKAKRFAELVRRHPAFQLMEEPQINIVVYRYIPEEMRHKTNGNRFNREDQYVINCINEVLQDQQFLMGNTFISRTTLMDTRFGKKVPIVVLRAVFANPTTTDEHLSYVLRDQVDMGDLVLKQNNMSFSQVLQLLYNQTSSFDRQ